MIFYCDGENYDSSDMIYPDVRDESVTQLFIKKDFSYVFGAYALPRGGVEVRRIHGAMLEELALRTGLAELRMAVRLAKYQARMTA